MKNMSILIPYILAIGFAKGLKEAESTSPVVHVSSMEIASIQFQLDRTDEEYIEAIGILIGRAQRVEDLEAILEIDFPSKDLTKEVESLIMKRRKTVKACQDLL